MIFKHESLSLQDGSGSGTANACQQMQERPAAGALMCSVCTPSHDRPLSCHGGAARINGLGDALRRTHPEHMQGSVILVRQKDQPGIIAGVSRILGEADVNISFMTVCITASQHEQTYCHHKKSQSRLPLLLLLLLLHIERCRLWLARRDLLALETLIDVLQAALMSWKGHQRLSICDAHCRTLKQPALGPCHHLVRPDALPESGS